jgi:hypothetical protein
LQAEVADLTANAGLACYARSRHDKLRYLVLPESSRRAGLDSFGERQARDRVLFSSLGKFSLRTDAGAHQTIPLEIRRLIREMSIANPFWGAPRIHGELLKLGIEIGQTSVAKYMARRRGPPSQGWKTFLRNHADGIVAMDLGYYQPNRHLRQPETVLAK